MATLDCRITVPKEVLFRNLDDEAVLLQLQTGQYYGLDAVGTRAWVLLAEHGQVDRVFQAMREEYEVDDERLRQGLLRLLDELASLQLLKLEET